MEKEFRNIAGFQIIPGMIQQLVFIAVQKNLISDYLPLEIKLKIENEYLTLDYKCHERLITKNELTETFSDMVNKYKIYSDREIIEEKSENHYKIKVPLLMLEAV